MNQGWSWHSQTQRTKDCLDILKHTGTKTVLHSQTHYTKDCLTFPHRLDQRLSWHSKCNGPKIVLTFSNTADQRLSWYLQTDWVYHCLYILKQAGPKIGHTSTKDIHQNQKMPTSSELRTTLMTILNKPRKAKPHHKELALIDTATHEFKSKYWNKKKFDLFAEPLSSLQKHRPIHHLCHPQIMTAVQRSKRKTNPITITKVPTNSCKTAVIISPYRRRDPSRLPRPHFRDLICRLTQPLLAQAPDPRLRKKEQSLPKIGMRTWIIKVYYKRQNCENQNSLTQIPWETNQVS